MHEEQTEGGKEKEAAQNHEYQGIDQSHRRVKRLFASQVVNGQEQDLEHQHTKQKQVYHEKTPVSLAHTVTQPNTVVIWGKLIHY